MELIQELGDEAPPLEEAVQVSHTLGLLVLYCNQRAYVSRLRHARESHVQGAQTPVAS